jgi:hypothetical protein
MIPIYEDTTEEEVAILWKQRIQHLKRLVYREPEEALGDGNNELERFSVGCGTAKA